MSPEYDIKIGDRDHRVNIERLDEGGLLVVKVGSQSFTIKAAMEEDGTWTVNDTDSDYAVKILKKGGKKVSLELNEQPLEVEWSRVRQQETAVTVGGASGTGLKVQGGVYPPMPGKITEVHVKVGDTVSTGATVCILEAMKMFNELKSPSDGIVKEVNVEVGSNVTTSDLLVLIE